ISTSLQQHVDVSRRYLSSPHLHLRRVLTKFSSPPRYPSPPKTTYLQSPPNSPISIGGGYNYKSNTKYIYKSMYLVYQRVCVILTILSPACSSCSVYCDQYPEHLMV